MPLETLPLFKGRHFQAEIIVLCLCWYLRYSLSYRDLEETMAERGLKVDHSTIAQWLRVWDWGIIPAGQASGHTVGFCGVEAILANKIPNAIPIFAFSGARLL